MKTPKITISKLELAQVQEHLEVLTKFLAPMPGLVVPSYLPLYATALVLSRMSPRPLERVVRHYNLVRLFWQTIKQVDGPIAECGVCAGLSSIQLCLSYRSFRPTWKGLNYHVFDSFQGLSQPQPEDFLEDNPPLVRANMTQGNYSVSLPFVQNVFARAGFPRVTLHPGWIPDRFPEVADQQFAFVHVDVDLAGPSRDALEFFYPRLLPGGVIVTDDLDWLGTRKVFEAYAARHGLELHQTNTNQGFFKKGHEEGAMEPSDEACHSGQVNPPR